MSENQVTYASHGGQDFDGRFGLCLWALKTSEHYVLCSEVVFIDVMILYCRCKCYLWSNYFSVRLQRHFDFVSKEKFYERYLEVCKSADLLNYENTRHCHGAIS